MKKLSAVLAIVLALTLLTPAALASGAQTTPVVYGLSVESGYSVSFKTADGAAAAAATGIVGGSTGTVYKNAAKLELSFTGNAGEQYAVFLLKDSEVPTQGSIKYIDQTEGSNVKFTVYPYDLSETGSYGLYVSSTSAGYKQVATFGVTDNWEEAPYVLGDVNMDGAIDVIDASVILRYAANLDTLINTQKAAADVNRDNTIDVIDASAVLRYAANLINGF
jgi:hypothetical protein